MYMICSVRSTVKLLSQKVLCKARHPFAQSEMCKVCNQLSFYFLFKGNYTLPKQITSKRTAPVKRKSIGKWSLFKGNVVKQCSPKGILLLNKF